MRVLFSCVGRRIELIRAFVVAAEARDIALETHGADHSPIAPGLFSCDRRHALPRISDAAYIPALLDIVRKERIDLLIPLLDPELRKLSDAREEFAGAGCFVPISDPSVIELFTDKLSAYRHFSAAGIPTPATWTAEEVLRAAEQRFPYFLKPRRGSAGMGNYEIRNIDELRVLSARVPQPLAQEFVDGVEHTLDVYTGLRGELRCVVPRRRLEVRGGEVSKSQVVLDDSLIQLGRRVIETIGGWRGVVTIQCIRAGDATKVIEVNARFGGGVPLSICAGADFPGWLLDELRGVHPDIRPESLIDGLQMLRYDRSVFVDADGNVLDCL